MESMQRQWKRFVEETQKSQEVVGQLSKLYIIIHENVREAITKCTLNLKYDPTPECTKHLATILDLLKRINNPTDAYLTGVDNSILTKFQEQLYDLSGQVQKLLKCYNNTTGIDVKLLQRIKKANEKEQYGLKDELKKSEQRRIRSRSGIRRSTPNIMEADPTQNLIEQFSEYKQKFNQKRKRLQMQMQGHIAKKDNQVIFSNKYCGKNLQNYFSLRKELFDLQMADQYTKRIIREHDQKEVEKNVQIANDYGQNKLFTEFKIKTKYMKKQVKENILNALVDVKMQLLQQYHNSNMKILNEANPDTLVVLGNNKNSKNNSALQKAKTLSNTKHKHSSSASTLHQHPQASPSQTRVTRQASLTRYPMAHKSCRPLVYKSGWSYEKQDDFRMTMNARFSQGRVPN